MPVKALIVDDEPDMEVLVRQAFRKKLRAGEYAFTFARNGAEALSMFELDPEIGIVMADINMPVMDGLTLLARIGDIRRVHRTVIVSAYDDLRNIRTAMNRGAYDFLTKPIDFVDFEATLIKASLELGTLQQGQIAKDQLAALQRELQIAQGIQRSMLPRNKPYQAGDPVQIHAVMLPASEVGGDLYDHFFIDSKRLGFAIGDVSGKGVPAALYMAVTRSLLRATALQGLPPQECLRYMNQVLVGQASQDMFVTLLYGIIDLTTGVVSYCTAGHTPPLVIAEGEPPQVLRDARGMMLGLFEEATFGTHDFVLRADQTLLLYTDGVTEAENPQHEFLSTSGLVRIMAEAPTEPRLAVNYAAASVEKYSEGTRQEDDVTIMGIRVNPQSAYLAST